MKNTTTDAARFTDLVITGAATDIAELTRAAHQAGVLVYRSAPQPAGSNDRRVKVFLRLHLHHR